MRRGPLGLRALGPFRWWGERIRRAVADKRVFPYLALTTLAIGLSVGFFVTLVDRKDFPTFGTGVWWAIVTLATVGYGDVVPHTAWGRVLGSIVIINGVTFIAFLTATVTSLFVSAEQTQARAKEQTESAAELDRVTESLRRIEQLLAAIDAKLGD